MPITVKGGPNPLCVYCIRGLAAVVGFLPVLLLRVGGSLMNGLMWRSVEAVEIYRRAPRSKGVVNRHEKVLGRPAWARFSPGSLPDASRSIVDLLPYACEPLASSSPQFR
jgi:hypothetical protein